jgi:hypothetical protein
LNHEGTKDAKTHHWEAVVNGRRTLNGERHSVTIHGHLDFQGGDFSIYEVMRQLADHLEESNSQMEYPDSFRITLHP